MNSQENLWSGDFGNTYTSRQKLDLLSTRVFFRKALKEAKLTNPGILEFGAGKGHNLRALRRIYEGATVSGVEINPDAFKELEIVAHHATLGSVLDPNPVGRWDLVFTKGLLIHIHPDYLQAAYQTIFDCSKRYILICEYFNQTPVAIEYHGEKDALWKRDFAGDMLDKFPLKVLDYGFTWKRDKYPQDDITWALLSK